MEKKKNNNQKYIKRRTLCFAGAFLCFFAAFFTVAWLEGKDSSDKAGEQKFQEAAKKKDGSSKVGGLYENRAEDSYSNEGETAKKETKILNVNGENKLIYCITPDTSNPFFQTIQAVCTQKGEELGYTVKCFSHDDDAQKQAELFEEAISQKASFIICDNAGTEVSIEPAKKAYDAGIGVFMIDREINQEGICAAQIVSDDFQGAVEAAKYLAEVSGAEGKYAELLGLSEDKNSQMRSEAFHSVIDNTDMKMVDQKSADWDQEKAQKQAEDILQKYPDITAFVCGNDTMACGAAAAIKKANPEQEIYIIGVDGSNEMRDNIKEGFATATALQQIDLITRSAVEQGDSLMTTGSTQEEEKQLISCQLITSDNADRLKDFVYSE